MKNVILPAQVLAAAKLCQAKGDVRYYLCGVYIDDKKIAGTNGHLMFVNDYSGFTSVGHDEAGKIDKPIIIDIQGNIPASAWTAHLNSLDDRKGYIEFLNGSKTVAGRTFFEFIDGVYPDTDRVMPKGEPTPTTKICLNQSYLSLAGKVFGKFGKMFGGEMSLFGESSVVKVVQKNHEYGELVMLIMPMRM